MGLPRRISYSEFKFFYSIVVSFKCIEIETIFNPYFDTTNNLMSLWTISTQTFHDDIIISNGDNIYKTPFLDTHNKTNGFHLAISKKESYDEDDMKVTLNNNQVIQINKKIPLDNTHAESVGFFQIIGKKERELFQTKLIECSKNKAFHNVFWLEAINELINDGITVHPFEIPADDWREIDYHPDINELKKHIKDL